MLFLCVPAYRRQAFWLFFYTLGNFMRKFQFSLFLAPCSFLLALSSLLLVLCSLLFACRFNPNLQGKGENYLQGVWHEDSVVYQDELLQYTRHQFKFTCDSFYVTLKTSAKVNTYTDSCFNNGAWVEYAKGTYTVINDTLYIYGTFTKPDFKQKISGCYRIGQYLASFIIKRHTNKALYFQSLQQHLPVKLNLKQKISCVPKPLN